MCRASHTHQPPTASSEIAPVDSGIVDVLKFLDGSRSATRVLGAAFFTLWHKDGKPILVDHLVARIIAQNGLIAIEEFKIQARGPSTIQRFGVPCERLHLTDLGREVIK